MDCLFTRLIALILACLVLRCRLCDHSLTVILSLASGRRRGAARG